MEPDYFPTDRSMDEPAGDPAATDRPAAKSERRRSGRLIAITAGTAMALGAGGVAYAATADPSPTPTDSAPSETAPDEVEADGDRPHGPVGGFGGGFGALHGEYVVETDDGVYETVATQRGTIDEITADSLTVTSEDGYTKTYVLDTAELDTGDRGPVTDPADLAAGDEVVVMANVEDSTATVIRVIDLANLPEHPMPGGPRWHSHGDGPPDAGTETTPDTTA